MRLIRSASRLRVTPSNTFSQASRSRALSSISSSSSSLALVPSTARTRLPRWNHNGPVAASSPSTPRTYASSSSSAAEQPLDKTALYDLHVAHGGKMVPFGGFHMPVQYASLSVAASHAFTRTRASLFDVGHMVQRRFAGPGAAAFLQRVTPADLDALPERHSTLSALLHPETGGIVDDTIVTRLGPDEFYVVTNAACRAKDDAYFAAELAAFDGGAVVHEKQDHKGLIALQGPLSAEILSELLTDPAEADLSRLFFGTCAYAHLRGTDPAGPPALISRGGYTGEDGFEISLPSAAATLAVTEALLAAAGPERLQLAGLGARDSLRLEAGMCLYGHDLDDTTTPVEAGLAWIVPRSRRGADAGFHGAARVAAQLVPKSKGGAGVERRRVGFVVEGAPAREGAEVVSREGGEALGRITSGCPSPTLGKNVAMGYVRDGFHKAGTEVNVVVRGKNRKAVVTKMPFVPTKYWKGTAPA